MSKKTKLPALKLVKKTLYADWAIRVKRADGWKCAMCGDTDRIAGHHWFVCDKQAHTARYLVANGITLCFACHLRKVHLRADYVTVKALYNYMMRDRNFGENRGDVMDMVNTDLTTAMLRGLWNDFRYRTYDIRLVKKTVRETGSKTFVVLTDNPNRMFIPYGHIQLNTGTYEVTVATKLPCGDWRYTIKPATPKEKKQNGD